MSYGEANKIFGPRTRRPFDTEAEYQRAQGSFGKLRKDTMYLVNAGARPSVFQVWDVINSQACTHQVHRLLRDGTVELLAPGSRNYSLRGLADRCGLAVNTVRDALTWLVKHKLITRFAANVQGTWIQIVKFMHHSGKKFWNKGSTLFAQRVDTMGAKSGTTYNGASTSSISNTDLVDVEASKKGKTTIEESILTPKSGSNPASSWLKTLGQ